MSQEYTIEDMYNDQTVQRFLRKKNGRNQRGLHNILLTIKDFCNFTDSSPTEIRNKHRGDLRNHVPEFDMWLNDALDDYVAHLIENKKSYNTINNYLTRIKGFLHAFKLKPTPKTEIPINKVEEDFKYALDVDDIRKAIHHSPLTYQVYIITQAQTGLSVSDVLLLDVEDFIRAVSKKNENLTLQQAIYRVKNDNNLIGCFDLRRKKTTQQFYTFAGPEVLQNMTLLLESRDEEFLQPNMPIFIKETYRLRESVRDPDNNPENLRLKPKAVENYFHRLHAEKKIFPKIEVDGKERNYFRTHKLRKWFSNQVKNVAGIGRDDTKFLMGQKTGDVIERYANPNDYTNLKNNYRKALPHLAINYDISMEENLEAIEQLEAKNEVLTEQLEQQNEEMRLQKEQHQREMEEMRELIKTTKTDTEKLVYDVLEKSKSLNREIKTEDLPSGEKILDTLGSAILKTRKDEVDEKKN